MSQTQTGKATAADERTEAARSVGNQQNWDTLRPEKSVVGLRSRKLPDGLVVLSSPLDCLSLHLLSVS